VCVCVRTRTTRENRGGGGRRSAERLCVFVAVVTPTPPVRRRRHAAVFVGGHRAVRGPPLARIGVSDGDRRVRRGRTAVPVGRPARHAAVANRSR